MNVFFILVEYLVIKKHHQKLIKLIIEKYEINLLSLINKHKHIKKALWTHINGR